LQAAHGRRVPSGNGLGREAAYSAADESCQSLIHFDSFINHIWHFGPGTNQNIVTREYGNIVRPVLSHDHKGGIALATGSPKPKIGARSHCVTCQPFGCQGQQSTKAGGPLQAASPRRGASRKIRGTTPCTRWSRRPNAPDGRCINARAVGRGRNRHALAAMAAISASRRNFSRLPTSCAVIWSRRTTSTSPLVDFP
jgi:hypothetical protein